MCNKRVNSRFRLPQYKNKLNIAPGIVSTGLKGQMPLYEIGCMYSLITFPTYAASHLSVNMIVGLQFQHGFSLKSLVWRVGNIYALSTVSLPSSPFIPHSAYFLVEGLNEILYIRPISRGPGFHPLPVSAWWKSLNARLLFIVKWDGQEEALDEVSIVDLMWMSVLNDSDGALLGASFVLVTPSWKPPKRNTVSFTILPFPPVNAMPFSCLSFASPYVATERSGLHVAVAPHVFFSPSASADFFNLSF